MNGNKSGAAVIHMSVGGDGVNVQAAGGVRVVLFMVQSIVICDRFALGRP